MKVKRAIVVTLTWMWALASLFKVFYVMGKALSGELSCTVTGLFNFFRPATHAGVFCKQCLQKFLWKMQ